MWATGVAIIVLAMTTTVACGGGIPLTQPTGTSVESYLPARPRMFFAGTAPPTYAGVWAGQIRHTACRSSTPGGCRINPIPRAVTLRLDQAGITVTGTMLVAGLGESMLSGYVAEDGAFYSPMTLTSDGGTRLERSGDELVGMKVYDSLQNSAIVQSNKYELTGLRRVTG